MSYGIINYPYYEAATWACRYIFIISELLARNLEAIAAWTGVVVDSFFFVPDHILYFYFVVEGTHDANWDLWG